MVMEAAVAGIVVVVWNGRTGETASDATIASSTAVRWILMMTTFFLRRLCFLPFFFCLLENELRTFEDGRKLVKRSRLFYFSSKSF